ncbi:MAG: hypothetical protein ACXU85_01805 [Xanthobacteraceae bacterium]
MIAENAEHLLSLVQSVPQLAEKSGFAVGGQVPDPGLSKTPLPAAWVILSGDQCADNDASLRPAIEVVEMTFVVMLYVPYLGQADLLANQFPLLEAVIKAARGEKAPSGHRWRYVGQRLALVNTDKLAYEQRYTLTAVL